MIIPVLALAVVAGGGCTAVTGARILGRDLALADPRFAFVPEETFIAHAPLAGVKRVLDAGEMDRIRLRWGGAVPPEFAPSPLCFEVPSEPLDPKALAEGLLRVTRAEEVTVVDYSRYPAPSGEIEFQAVASGRPAADGSRLYRGRIRYAGNRVQAIWARAICRFRTERLVAGRDLEPGTVIDASSVERRVLSGGDAEIAGTSEMSGIVGRAPARRIAAGEVIDPRRLRILPEIQRGDRVRVEVTSGRARISFDARAESPGRRGEQILLLDPASGRRFRAAVAGPGSAAIDASRARIEREQREQ